jgi:hypothetical protein
MKLLDLAPDIQEQNTPPYTAPPRSNMTVIAVIVVLILALAGEGNIYVWRIQ